MRRAGHEARYGGEERCILGFQLRKSEGSRPPGKPRRRGDDNIKMHFQKVEWAGVGVGWARTGLIWLRIGTGGGHL